MDKNDNRCSKIYQNIRSSTGNLIVHLRDVHQIINEDDESENISKKVNILLEIKFFLNMLYLIKN